MGGDLKIVNQDLTATWIDGPVGISSNAACCLVMKPMSTVERIEAMVEEPAEIYCFPWRGRLFRNGKVDWYKHDPNFGDPHGVMPKAMRERAKPTDEGEHRMKNELRDPIG